VGSGVGGFRIHDGRSLVSGCSTIFAQLPDRDNPRSLGHLGSLSFQDKMLSVPVNWEKSSGKRHVLLEQQLLLEWVFA
jgi:hypothetical protein